MSFFLFFKRDIRQLFLNPRLMILPFSFFMISLFLIYFTQGHSVVSENKQALYWVVFILSTTGVLGQNIARDYHLNFLQALQSERLNLTPYILSKGLSLLMAWSVPFWIFRVGGAFFEGALTLLLCTQYLVTTLVVSGALAFLYCLFDVLFLQGRHSPFLSVVLLTPFMLPLLILGLMGLEQDSLNSLIPTIGYGVFLMAGSFLMTQRAICR